MRSADLFSMTAPQSLGFDVMEHLVEGIIEVLKRVP